MSLLTFAAAKESRLKRIAGVCTDNAEFKALLNDATRMLMNRGSWWATVQPLQGCVYNNCITWNRYVGTVLAVNVGCQTGHLSNHWYEFMPMEAGMVSHYRACNCGGTINVVADGMSPVYRQIECNQEMYIRAYIDRNTDVGKTITLFGINNNGQPIRSLRDDGTYQDGVILTFAKPYVSTSFPVRKITKVIKDTTDGNITLWQYDATNDVLLDMATYEPGETAPSYRHSKIMGYRAGCNCSGTCGGLTRIQALVKLEFVPVVYDTDLVLIENVDALATAMQSIKASDAYDPKTAEAEMARAVHELNLELSNRFPIDQIPVIVNAFGTASPRRHGIGRML